MLNESQQSNESVRKLFDQYMVPNYAPATMIPAHAKGSHVTDIEGKDYIDFAAGVAVNSLGHAHPAFLKALREQSEKVVHISNYFTNLPALELAEELCKNTFAEQVFFANSGAEVNEAALKLARRYGAAHFGPEKNEIIAFLDSFHGRTLFTVSVGGQKKYTEGLEPLPTGITHLPFNNIEELSKHISSRTCAVIVEPIQGEGGVNEADPKFMEAIRELTLKHNALFILDEVQTGVGRTGALYAYQQLNVTPDILTTAKGIGGGFPIGAMLTTKKIAASLNVGSHGSTFGGNALGCAVALSVFKEINKPEIFQGVTARRHLFEEGLHSINKKYPFFDKITGKGLLIGLHLKEKYQGKAKMFSTAALNEGLMVLVAGLSVLRFAPSLIIPENDIREGLVRLEKAVSKLS